MGKTQETHITFVFFVELGHSENFSQFKTFINIPQHRGVFVNEIILRYNNKTKPQQSIDQ